MVRFLRPLAVSVHDVRPSNILDIDDRIRAAGAAAGVTHLQLTKVGEDKGVQLILHHPSSSKGLQLSK